MSSFYSGAYTSEGFRYIKLNSVNPDCFKYILKGKSDSVKDKVFRSVCDKLDKNSTDYTVSLNYDNRIIGIHCEEKNFIICDGTYPFDEEPVTYGAVDGIISTEFFQDSKILRLHAQDIIELNNLIINQERRCERFLSAAAGLSEDKKRLEKDITDTRKISRYTAKLWSAHGCPPGGKVGVEKNVFLSVPAASGVKCADIDVSEFCDTAIVIVDPVGNSADMIVDRIRRYALSSGADIISCRNFLHPDGNPQHVIVPSMRFGVLTESKEILLNVPNIKKVKSTRFITKQPAENIRVRLQFNRRAHESLMKEVTSSIKKIAEYNSELDRYYQQATDENALIKSVLNTLV